MRVISALLATSALIVIVFVTTPTALAKSGWGLEDPQLCVNGELLTVVPGAPANVFVALPVGTAVDYAVDHCGGDPSLGVVPSSNVSFQGGKEVNVTAHVPDGTKVTFSWNDRKLKDRAEDGVASVQFTVK